MSGTNEVTLGTLSDVTAFPSGGGILIAQPSSSDPTKLVFGLITMAQLFASMSNESSSIATYSDGTTAFFSDGTPITFSS